MDRYDVYYDILRPLVKIATHANYMYNRHSYKCAKYQYDTQNVHWLVYVL